MEQDINQLFHSLADDGDMERKFKGMRKQIARNNLADQERDLLLVLIGIELGLDTDPRFRNLFNRYI